ncbi:gamma-glutamyl-gamma-aminobutyrate hydrolase family protein [Pectobacterium colocasium]|uniref:gamma-glutamyl-gamma-aminobutyrate hydrolase family protein n=1 Tax=Pectobacterium colocasium TaxID=2878098 RepID=UPI001CD5B943|nr:gamma-glutamyl-gamma-aminobutyrate hydrolase family protein [Pectobacterium colocasium]
MKFAAITMRSDMIISRNERRDSLDVRWYPFLNALGAQPIIVPNDRFIAEQILVNSNIDFIVLSGGGDVSSVSGRRTERDQVEEIFLAYSKEKNIPVIGVCRGMQKMVEHCGGKLRKVERHTNIRHRVTGIHYSQVNSFHNYGIEEMPEQLIPFVLADDGTVEAFFSKELNWLGVMWHPEREEPFSKIDLITIMNFLKGVIPCTV